jgi:hypothetical protein
LMDCKFNAIMYLWSEWLAHRIGQGQGGGDRGQGM